MALKDILATTQLVGSQFANAYGQGLASRQQAAMEDDRAKARAMENRKLGMVEQDYKRGVEALTGQERTRAIGVDSKLKKLQDTLRAHKSGITTTQTEVPWQSNTTRSQMIAKIDSAKSRLTQEQDTHLRNEAKRFGIPEPLAYAQMAQESDGDDNAVSSAGAIGLFQLMPATAGDLGVDMNNPLQNITGGLKYLKQQIDAEGGNVAAGLARYNSGPGAYKKHMRVGLHDLKQETKQYLSNVLSGSGLYDDKQLSGLTSQFSAKGTSVTGPARKLTDDQLAVSQMLPGLLSVSPLGIAAPTVGREADYGAFQRVLSSLGTLKRAPAVNTPTGVLNNFNLKRIAQPQTGARTYAKGDTPTGTVVPAQGASDQLFNFELYKQPARGRQQPPTGRLTFFDEQRELFVDSARAKRIARGMDKVGSLMAKIIRRNRIDYGFDEHSSFSEMIDGITVTDVDSIQDNRANILNAIKLGQGGR